MNTRNRARALVLLAGAIGIVLFVRRRVAPREEAPEKIVGGDDPWGKQVEKELEEMS